MSTHINGIVQVTRKMIDLDRPETGTEWQALQDERQELVLTAIRDGVEADLIHWAIGMNDSRSKIQIQHAVAHLAAAEALEAGGE